MPTRATTTTTTTLSPPSTAPSPPPTAPSPPPTTTEAKDQQQEGDDEDDCPIRNQSSKETNEDNFNVETISHLNERVRCRNPNGSLEMNIHLVSPDWG